MAIREGMSIVVARTPTYLPLAPVIETPRPEPGENLSQPGASHCRHGDYLPWSGFIASSSVLDAATDFTRGSDRTRDETDGLKAVLFADALVGQHQVSDQSLLNKIIAECGISRRNHHGVTAGLH